VVVFVHFGLEIYCAGQLAYVLVRRAVASRISG